MKIIFFGASRFVIPIIEMLNTSFELALVVTTERDPLDTVPQYCNQHQIPFISVKVMDETVQKKIQEIHADVAVLAYFGLLLPQNILEMFPHGILNIHPSLLPLYRGATPVQSALLNGDSTTGVTIIKLDNQMDHGPILGQTSEEITASDTKETLHDRLFTKGTEMLKELIPPYVNGKIALKEQQHALATLTKRSFTKQDGYIAADNPPAPDELDRMIRAYYPWPGVWTKLTINGKEKTVKILPCHPEVNAEGSKLQESTKDASVTPQHDKQILLQVEGKKPMSIKEFLNGYPQLRDQLSQLLSLK